jgi:DNA gyrase/topoisomerase IV subunit A
MDTGDGQRPDLSKLKLLEAEFLAATRGPEILGLAGDAPSSKAAIEQVMLSYSLDLEQAVKILDSPFRVATADNRERIRQEIDALKARLSQA